LATLVKSAYTEVVLIAPSGAVVQAPFEQPAGRRLKRG
jgi:hypothetical protein